jgi:hypothetical protein
MGKEYQLQHVFSFIPSTFVQKILSDGHSASYVRDQSRNASKSSRVTKICELILHIYRCGDINMHRVCSFSLRTCQKALHAMQPIHRGSISLPSYELQYSECDMKSCSICSTALAILCSKINAGYSLFDHLRPGE